MSDTQISVIVAVYNTKDYLYRCVNSIIKQSYQNLDILLINDGSTDGSFEICNRLAEQDSRIRVIHQENCGLSVVRNFGIKNAQGSFITFIDSDDYVTQDYVANLYELIIKHNADISITSYIKKYDDDKMQLSTKRSKVYTLVMNKNEAMEEFLYQRHFTTAIWGRLFRKNLFDNITFAPGKTAQDVGVMYKLIDKANLVVYKSIPDYIYVQRMTSTVYSRKTDRERDSLFFAEEMYGFILENYPEFEQAVLSRCFSINIQILMRISFKDIYNKDHNTVRSNIKKYRGSVFRNPKARLKNRGCATLSYFGIWVLKIFLNVFS